jgi:DNA-binding IclR family transcriptional regulator
VAPVGVGRRSGAETARKVFQLLLHFNRDRGAASVRELATASGLPLPTAHRYVALLRELGLLEETSRSRYQLGWRVVQLARVAEAAGGLLQLAEPVMRRLVAETDETAVLFRLAGEEMECVGQVESDQVMRLSFEPGQRLPLTRGASARILLGGLPRHERLALLDALAIEDPDFARRRPRFERDIAEVERRGWAESREEIDRGIWAVAAPVVDESRVAASLAVAGPLYRIEADVQRRVPALVTRAAAEVSRLLAARRAA